MKRLKQKNRRIEVNS